MAQGSDLLSIISNKCDSFDTLFPVPVMQVLVVKIDSIFFASMSHGNTEMMMVVKSQDVMMPFPCIIVYIY